DELDFILPSPPTESPEPSKDSNPTNNGLDRFNLSERDSYMWSLGSVDLPSMLALNDGVERLLWPAEEEFPDHNGFEEGKDYVLITRVGEGAFGECFMAVELPYDKEREFCLLVLTLARKESVAEIVQFYGAKLKGKSASIFMEFMKGGTIAELFEDEKKNCAKAVGVVSSPPVISEIYCLWYLENVLRALVFLHKKGIVHRDVKGLNVLLPEDRRNAKLADFGSAENRKNMGTFIDIWKTGCFFLEMWNGERPSSLLALTEGGSVHPQRQTSCRPEDHIPLSASNETKELLRLCFGVNNE
ncbi:unnamed protein product, partial [Porites evermanni]